MDRLVAIDIAVSYLEVEITVRVAAHPGLVVYGRSLTSKVGKWQQVALGAFSTIGPSVYFHVPLLNSHRRVVKKRAKYNIIMSDLTTIFQAHDFFSEGLVI